MCGIAGVVHFNVTEPVNRRLIECMTSALAHRGPDDYGYLIAGNVGLGHRRLSIIDLSGGRQPIFNEDGSIGVVFNGEIYNYRDLAPELAGKGHQFRTKSDTETIVHAYEELGDECMRDFRGMFAFALHDRRQNRVLLVRDRLGIKPLYYYCAPDFVAFASEIKALLQHPGVPREVDREALDMYLALRYVPGPKTMFRNIFKLQPGHRAVIDAHGFHIRKYWDIEYRRNGARTEQRLLEEFEHLLEESVRLRLISDVPLGVFLSGGLDSTTMLAMMKRIGGGGQLKTFSVGYTASGRDRAEVDESNEFPFARGAADHFQADHHEFHLTAPEFRDAIPTIVSHLDEPLADPTCIPLYFVSKLAREHVTVVLSGEGADEIAGGYTLYRRLLALDRLRSRLGPAAALMPFLASLPLSDRPRAYLRRAGTPIERHYRGVVKGLSVEIQLALSGADRLASSARRLDGIFEDYFAQAHEATTLNRMLFADAKVWLVDDLLLKADKMTMATSLELRVPFLDHKLVEFAAALPDSFKIRQGQGKWILREVMKTILPSDIIQRPKKGFSNPTAAWLRYEMRDMVRDSLLSTRSACREFFRHDAIEDVISRHEKGKSYGHQEVWSLLIFEVWHRQFIERFAPAPLHQDFAVEV